MNLREAAQQATPREQLLKELMDSRVSKTEREHAAAREIERLRADRGVEAVTQDWDEVEALRESLREHMAEIHRLRAAGWQAIDAMDSKHDMTKAEWRVLHYRAFTALRAALAEATIKDNLTVEPVAYVQNKECNKGIAFYTAPPKRKPLTDEEIDHLAQLDGVTAYKAPDWFIELARAIERAHNIGESK